MKRSRMIVISRNLKFHLSDTEKKPSTQNNIKMGPFVAEIMRFSV